MNGKRNHEPEKGNEDPLNYHSPNMSADWRLSGANLANRSIQLIPTSDSMAACKGDLGESYPCSTASMVDSFCPTIWDQTPHSQNLGLCEINVGNSGSTSNTVGIRTSGLAPLRSGVERMLDIGWTPPNPMLKGDIFLPTTSRLLPQSIPQFPADSGFIERAARFSCFGAGNFGDMMNPFGIPESMNAYSQGLASMKGPQVDFFQSQKNETNMTENPKDVEHGGTEGSLLKNDEANQGVDMSSNESDEAAFSGGGGGQEERSIFEGGERSAKGLGSNKRKRSGQDTEIDQVKGSPQQTLETLKDYTEIQQMGNQNPVSATNKTNGKQGKQGAQASDSPKEEYIHVRARRGQATNSHSLAERVRREKISERMKLLQDLVPGCSKVTGKAVMLDEIINYVQSLQQQVEFLSMKLATVNPRLDLHIEELLAKDVLQSRSGPLVFPTDATMPHPLLHSAHPGLIQAGLPGMGSSLDVLRRNINSQVSALSGGYKDPASQGPNVWDDELHNVFQMGFNSSATNAPLSSQDLSVPQSPGHMKAER